MKTIQLCGKTYPLRFSLRVVKACEERYGSLEKMFSAVQMKADDESGGLGVVDDCLWLLSSMLDAGYRYAKLNGDTPEATPDADTLLDALDIPDMQATLFDAITGDNERTVEAKPGKNGEGAAESG